VFVASGAIDQKVDQSFTGLVVLCHL
jgi:hypothetical protein